MSPAIEIARDKTHTFLKHSNSDALLIVLSLIHAGNLLAAPSSIVIGIGLWWNANTISHYFIHLPFFKSRALNKVYTVYLTLLLGVPQTLWHDRHLAHHSERPWRLIVTPMLLVETLAIGALWSSIVSVSPSFFWGTYIPGYVFGLFLCFIHGHYEHARGTTSHYGKLYNCLFFNDGYHKEHHASPSNHWTVLPHRKACLTAGSRWPAPLRWLECVSLDSLEHLVLRFPGLQRWVLAKHERALHQLIPNFRHVQKIGIIGGGLFPRTALIIRKLLPEVQINIFDASQESIDLAKPFLQSNVIFVHQYFDGSNVDGMDLLIIPLSLIGNRAEVYRQPAAPLMLIHDWIWRPRGTSAVVSWAFLKRINLIRA